VDVLDNFSGFIKHSILIHLHPTRLNVQYKSLEFKWESFLNNDDEI
jgi:hypothetical protein